jgi:hypothetical protein
MAYRRNQSGARFVRIVYSKSEVNGRTQLVPMELYEDGSVKRAA